MNAILFCLLLCSALSIWALTLNGRMSEPETETALALRR
jgi:hypothetical protein